jgi:hypothetical protein
MRYKILFDTFLIIRDVRYGNLLHLPFEGGAAEQPAKTMEGILLIQSIYREKIEEENKKLLPGRGLYRGRPRVPRRR